MANVNPNPVLWNHGAAPTAPPPRRGSSFLWLARVLLLTALAFTVVGMAQAPFFAQERVEADVLFVVNAPTEAVLRRTEKLAGKVKQLPGVHSVRLRLDRASHAVTEWDPAKLDKPPEEDGPRIVERELADLVAEEHSRPRLVLFVRPMTRDLELAAWAERVEQCRRAGIAIGAIDLVVLDPLAAFLPGRDESHAGLMLEALAPLQRLTTRGVAVLLLHHPRKGDTLFRTPFFPNGVRVCLSYGEDVPRRGKSRK